MEKPIIGHSTKRVRGITPGKCWKRKDDFAYFCQVWAPSPIITLSNQICKVHMSPTGKSWRISSPFTPGYATVLLRIWIGSQCNLTLVERHCLQTAEAEASGRLFQPVTSRRWRRRWWCNERFPYEQKLNLQLILIVATPCGNTNDIVVVSDWNVHSVQNDSIRSHDVSTADDVIDERS